ncbi:argininosuccinate lyase, partial [bacterium]|nr:argininosuccinate lyase [bacterium]
MTAKRNEKSGQAMDGPVWGRRLASRAGAANVAYCAGWDVRRREAADLELLPYDLWTNRAHCVMLGEVGVIPKVRLRKILRALAKLEKEHRAGRFELNPRLEDVHLNVESFVEMEAGPESAGLMHTARSRNDQVATDMRLWLRDRVLEFAEAATGLVGVLEDLARRHTRTLMPGLTHHQPAAWTTLGHWAASHAWAFVRDVNALLDLMPLLNMSPLGAAASYGTSWPIDRDLTARLMGFSEVQTNSLDCVTNRSEGEARTAGVVSIWAQHAATLCQDLILFSSPPWQLMRLDDAFVTGSSIMPQKRNPDFAEVTKAKAALAGSIASALPDLTRGNPSGYNREQQWSKYLILELFAELMDSPVVLSGAIGSLSLDTDRMRTLLKDDYLEAADVADYLAQTRGVPFRFAYRWLGEAVRLSEEQSRPLSETVNVVLEKETGGESLSEGESRDLKSPEFLLGRRTSSGGPSADSVRSQCIALRRRAGNLGNRIQRFREGIEAG